MKLLALNLLQKVSVAHQIDESLSLVPFANFLKTRLEKDEEDVRNPFFRFVLKKIRTTPGWDQPIRFENLNQYKNLFELIYYSFSPPMERESESSWAIGEPLSLVLFFGTAPFYQMLATEDGFLKGNPINGSNLPDIDKGRLKIIYSLVLERFYHLSSTFKKEIIHSFRDEETRLNKFFRLEFDTRFIDVKFNGTLPKLDISAFNPDLYDEDGNLGTLQKVLPAEQFRFEGFSIVHVTDITAEYTLEYIKDTIVNLSPGRQVYTGITHSLKNLLGDRDLAITLLPFLKVNDQLALNSLEDVRQQLAEQCKRYGFDGNAYMEKIAAFTNNPRMLFYPDIDVKKPDEPAIIPFMRNGLVKSLAIIPFFSNHNVVGIVEICSKKKNGMDLQKMTLLRPVIPLLGQLLQSVVSYLDQRIDDVIREKFTSLQPSVQWRFNEAAWRYIQRRQRDDEVDIERVFFSNVYPLFGAIDIRNSTVQRNEALQNDMHCRLNMIVDLLTQLKKDFKFDLLDELIFKAEGWRDRIGELVTSEGELRLLRFFGKEAEPFLTHIRQSGGGRDASLIDAYFQATRANGQTCKHRTNLEDSLRLINTTIDAALERMNSRIQEVYPCYFEKFRSDGMEYDIYIGQSITPGKPFDALYLRNLRLIQLMAMAEITRLTDSLLPRLPTKLETTQLIFVHANTIDISFRNDERRFDVEGAYNIRYEIVKKRIDKAYLKNSSERLTQPGKIAIVYFKQKNEEEYGSYIRYMQNQGILEDNVEYLELEDLQGVSGLKAMRLTVRNK